MPDDTPSEILGSLPRTRPHRRSEKRDGRKQSPATAGAESERPGPDAAGPATTSPPQATGRPNSASPVRRGRRPPQRKSRADPLRQPEQPSGTPPAPRPRRPVPASGTELLSTVVQATAELTEIGLSVSARAVRGAISRLPRP